MANINLASRARIGLEKRARTKALLVAAGGALFSRRPGAAITIDDIVGEAGVAKGTFYTHFEDLDDFTAAVAHDLIAGLDGLLVPLRLAIEDPFVRTAFGCDAFFGKAFEDRPWAGLVARMVRANAAVGRDTRARFATDVTQALAALPEPSLAPELAVEATLGIVQQVLAAVGEGRLRAADREPATGAVLSAIGAGEPRIAATLERVREIRRSVR